MLLATCAPREKVTTTYDNAGGQCGNDADGQGDNDVRGRRGDEARS